MTLRKKGDQYTGLELPEGAPYTKSGSVPPPPPVYHYSDGVQQLVSLKQDIIHTQCLCMKNLLTKTQRHIRPQWCRDQRQQIEETSVIQYYGQGSCLRSCSREGVRFINDKGERLSAQSVRIHQFGLVAICNYLCFGCRVRLFTSIHGHLHKRLRRHRLKSHGRDVRLRPQVAD